MSPVLTSTIDTASTGQVCAASSNRSSRDTWAAVGRDRRELSIVKWSGATLAHTPEPMQLPLSTESRQSSVMPLLLIHAISIRCLSRPGGDSPTTYMRNDSVIHLTEREYDAEGRAVSKLSVSSAGRKAAASGHVQLVRAEAPWPRSARGSASCTAVTEHPGPPTGIAIRRSGCGPDLPDRRCGTATGGVDLGCSAAGGTAAGSGRGRCAGSSRAIGARSAQHRLRLCSQAALRTSCCRPDTHRDRPRSLGGGISASEDDAAGGSDRAR